MTTLNITGTLYLKSEKKQSYKKPFSNSENMNISHATSNLNRLKKLKTLFVAGTA